MKAEQYRWLFIGGLTAFFILLGVSGPPAVGVDQAWSTDGYYRIAGGTNPWLLGVALLIIGFYALLMHSPHREPGPSLPGVLRRFVAFWLDFVIGIAALAPILGVLPTLVEWWRTGAFAWDFVRTTPALGYSLVTGVEFLLASIGLLFYYALPLTRGKPSPGSCIVGYQIVSDDGKQLTFNTAMTRTLYGLIAVMFAYFGPFVSRDRSKGKIWLDKLFRTRAVLLN